MTYHRNDERCCNCDEPASGRHSLPVKPDFDFAPVDYGGEWAGKASCENCYNMHVAAGDRCTPVLEAYGLATQALRDKLNEVRLQLASIATLVSEAQHGVGR